MTDRLAELQGGSSWAQDDAASVDIEMGHTNTKQMQKLKDEMKQMKDDCDAKIKEIKDDCDAKKQKPKKLRIGKIIPTCSEL